MIFDVVYTYSIDFEILFWILILTYYVGTSTNNNGSSESVRNIIIIIYSLLVKMGVVF